MRPSFYIYKLDEVMMTLQQQKTSINLDLKLPTLKGVG